MAIWMHLDAVGIRIIDVRDERAAVYMAVAHAELTGTVGVAMVTAGPGVTNAMTGIANAHVARASVLILSGTPPRPQENRGALQDMAHTDFVRPLTRYARTVREPDLVLQELVIVTLGRRLDFQLAYGSPAVFGDAKFLRIADAASELRDNRRAAVEVLATPSAAIRAMLAQAGERAPITDRVWAQGVRKQHLARAEKLQTSMANAKPGSDGLMHPNRLLAALRAALPENAVVIADGGDFLSFARVGLPASTYLDPGPLGCIGVGTPFGIAAALACPGRTVVVATGDGSFGFNTMEIDTAARHKAPVLIVVANNGSWAIEVRDQQETHGRVVGTRLQFSDHAAMARAFGLHAERIEKVKQLDGAIARAIAALERGPALLDVLVTPDAASSDATSGLAWVPDLQALGAWDAAQRQWRNG